MAEVLAEFDTAVMAPDGTIYVPRACGEFAADGLWDGWLEFVPRTDPSRPILRTGRETAQPKHEDLENWAVKLSTIYLEGAFKRALYRERRPSAPIVTPAARAPADPPRAVLDPFAVHAQGEKVLRQELSALSTDHLRNIIRAYDLGPEPRARASRAALVDAVIAGVHRRAGVA